MEPHFFFRSSVTDWTLSSFSYGGSIKKDIESRGRLPPRPEVWQFAPALFEELGAAVETHRDGSCFFAADGGWRA